MTTRLRVALDALPLQVRSAGVAAYVRELTRALAALDAAPELQLFGLSWPAPPPHDAEGRAWPGGVNVVASPRYPLVMGAPVAALPRLVDCAAVLGAIDVFHATAYAVPRARHTPVVLTVHDLTLLRAPELGTPALCRSVRRAAALVGEARLVIADSEATRRDLLAFTGVRAESTRVVPLGVGGAFRPQPPEAARAHVAAHLGVADRFLLHVGTLEPRKNLPFLIDACARLWRDGRLTHRLVLAGAPGWGAAAVTEAIERHAAERFVIRLGQVAAADLPILYAAADGVVVPSRDEGFGLSLLEGMACGTPVVAADAGALPEVAGDAALVVDPADADAWADAIARVLADQDLAARLRTAGPARAAQFTWARCARETLAVYEEAVRT